jgi:hypothetical protein
MAQPMTQIACPNCRTPIQANVEQLIDISVDPSAKAQLLSGSLNSAHCTTCGFEGMLSTLLVYHDPEKELLLTYVPVEINIPKDEQEKVIGQLINRVLDRLPPEDRKAYLLQPQSILTLQGLIDRILEADGITKEEIEAQREKMRLFEELLRQPEEHLRLFVEEHDDEFDATFFQLATLTIQATNDQRASEMLAHRLNQALEFSTFGKKIQAQEDELQAAMDSLREEGEELSRERILELLIEAPNDDRVVALINLTRPALDYAFFQLLTEKIDAAEGDEKERLSTLRQTALEVTQQIDAMQQARAAQAAELLKTIAEAEDLEAAVEAALPAVDELFLGTLQANIRVAQERGDEDAINKLNEIDALLQKNIAQALPKGIMLAQEVMRAEDAEAANTMMETNIENIDSDFLNSLMVGIQTAEESGDKETAERLRVSYKYGLHVSMRAKKS